MWSREVWIERSQVGCTEIISILPGPALFLTTLFTLRGNEQSILILVR